jgi:hypothetical protein
MLGSVLLVDGLPKFEDCHVVCCDAVLHGINSAYVSGGTYRRLEQSET